MKNFFIALGAFFFVFLFVGCQNKEKNVIKIGALLSLTGNNAAQGNLAKNGILLGVEKVNEQGGVDGKLIELIIEDTETSVKGTLNAFKKITSTNEIVAIITTGDTEFQAINSLAEQSQIPVIATICTGMLDEGRSSWLFRYCYNEVQEDECLMNFVKKDLEINNLALLYPNTLFGQDFYKYSKKYIEANNINIVANIAYDFNSTDQRSDAMKTVKANPDIICARGFGSALDALLRHISELGYKGRIIGDLSLVVPSTLNNTNGIMEGAYIVASDLDIASDSKIIKKYVKEYRNKFNLEPCFWDAIGYDSFIFICEAIKNAGVSTLEIKKALYQIEPKQLLLGNNKFENKNDVSFDMHIFQLNNNKLVKMK